MSPGMQMPSQLSTDYEITNQTYKEVFTPVPFLFFLTFHLKDKRLYY